MDKWVDRPGWGDVQWLQFPEPVGRRRVHNCDVPELELFPQAFGAASVRFSAGLELNFLNYLLSLCSLPCRWFGLDLSRRARLFLNVSLMLFPFGTTNGSLAIWVRGRDHAGRPDRAPDRPGDGLRRPGHSQLGGRCAGPQGSPLRPSATRCVHGRWRACH